MKKFNKIKGNRGEIIAQNFLKKSGYEILTTNFACKLGEIDIIARTKKTLVFVEVKFRETARFGEGLEAVGFVKQNKIRNTACVFLSQYPQFDGWDLRFDVISILGDEIEHIQGAF